MALPASENTTTARQGWVYKENGDLNAHKKIVNAGSAINQGDFVLYGPWFGIADEDIAASTGEGTIHVGQEYRVGAARTGTSQTFADVGQEVYYDSDDGLFYEADDATRKLVGYVTVAADSAGVFAFEGLKHVRATPEYST
jgi:predicted RecA/RadA family phage recombinase